MTTEPREKLSTAQGLGIIAQQAIWPVIGALFHPAYMIINAVLLGKLKPDTAVCTDQNFLTFECATGKQYLAAFGLGQAVCSLVVFSTGTTYSAVLTNLIPQAYGSQEYEVIGVYLNRMLILASCIFVPLLLPLQFVQVLFDQMVEPQVSVMAT